MFRSNTGDSPLKKFGLNILSGYVVGTFTLLIVYPMDVAATRMALDVGPNPRYSGFIDAVKKTIEKDGFSSLFAGYMISSLGIIVYRGFYFALYDWYRSIAPEKWRASFLHAFFAGWAVTIAAGLACYPIDTIRRRMILEDNPSTTFGTMSQIYKQEGLRGFWKGAAANIVRSICGALVLVLYDRVAGMLRHK